MFLPRTCAAAAGASLILTATAAHAARTNGDVASFYSTGRITASGEKFDKSALKAAHPTLPFGSIVKVVNRHNGRWVIVEINDRGPAKWTRRTIDLTQEAAKRVGMIRRGVVPVHLEIAQVTRGQLNRAFGKLMKIAERKAALEAQASVSSTSYVTPAVPDPAREPTRLQVASAGATDIPKAALEAEASIPQVPYAAPAESEPARSQVAAAVAGDAPRPMAKLNNLFKSYLESLIRPAYSHVKMNCADGQPLPEKLQVVLRRAAWEFNGTVYVLSGYRSLAYNRGIYGHRCKAGKCRGDRSQHIVCKAADIRITGVSAARLYSWAMHQPELGGVGRYPGDFIHVDIRPRPRGQVVTWDWRGRKYARKHSAKRRYAKLGS